MPVEKKQEHTPLPWRIDPYHGTAAGAATNPNVCTIYPSDSFSPICRVPIRRGGKVPEIPDYSERDLANARYIVKSVNHYERLVEALNKALAYLANPQAFDADALGRDWFALKAELGEEK